MKDFFKNKKIIFGIVILVVSASVFISSNKNENKTTAASKEPKNLTEAVALKNNKDVNSYKKINSGAEILNHESMFTEYTFTTNNGLYIFDANKLNEGDFVYQKVYDVPSNIKILNIKPSLGRFSKSNTYIFI